MLVVFFFDEKRYKVCPSIRSLPLGFLRITSRGLVGFGRLMVRWNGKRQALNVLLDLAKNIQN